ncbi:helix-turn-helix domain-containing protein [Phyllobacterium ifriqiyense]|uniref:helix-turn-helix domain-containing protein n=1 Tax=Phyllobacterium ifriqiyense TaxID=314238 RepID=UPI00339A6471
MAENRTAQRPPKLGPVVQTERKRQKLTLEQLAIRSGVSKSMLSQIERGEANPTFAVVWSLTQALEIDFTALIGGSVATSTGDIEVTSAAHTPEIRSADSLCRLKILSPPRLAGQSEWYRVEIAPGGKLDSEPHASGTSEHFTAITDGLEVKSGESHVLLNAGETARYPGDVHHHIRNIGEGVATGFLVVLYR